MIGKIWDVNAVTGRYLSTDFVVSDSKMQLGHSLRVTLWGGLGDVLVERKTKHVGICAVVLTGMSVKDYNNKLYLSISSSTVIYDDDDIPCLQELKDDSSSVQPTKAVLAVDNSLPREWTLEDLLIWARNRQNNTVTFHCKVMIENFRNKKGWNYPSCGYEKCRIGAARQHGKWYRLEVVVADDTAHTVVVMFNDTATEMTKCSAESLMVTDDEGSDTEADSNFPIAIRNLIGTTHVLKIKSHTYYEYGSFESFTCWKINPSESVEDAASSSTPTLTADEASPVFKSVGKHPTVKTPSKPNEEKKKRPELEDSDEEEVGVTVDNKKKRQRYIEDDFESAWALKFHQLRYKNTMLAATDDIKLRSFLSLHAQPIIQMMHTRSIHYKIFKEISLRSTVNSTAGLQNKQMIIPSLTELLQHSVRIDSNLITRQDGRVQSYYGLRLIETPLGLSGTDQFMLPDTTRINITQIAGPSTFKYATTRLPRRSAEREEKSKNAVNPTFSLCCQGGKLLLPCFNNAPPPLNYLLSHNDTSTTKFKDQIRLYNNMFSFMSFDARIDRSIITGRAPYIFRINEQNCHRIGSLLPQEGMHPKFAQLYYFDMQNKVRNQTGAFIDKETSEGVDEQIVVSLIQMLDQYSSVDKAFCMARYWCTTHNSVNVHLRLHSERKTTRQYNAPTVSEVAALIVNDFEDSLPIRDIIQRPNESSTLLRGGCMFEQYLVDAYTAVEEQRLNWTKNNQDTLRVELYHNMCNAVTRGDTSAVGLGKRIVLSRTFTGSPRYMMQNYQDAMALCRTYSNPDLFITFTSNPKWPEISEMLSYFPGQKSHDRPEIGTRIFKIKLTELLDDLTKKHVFGKSRGDDIISAELPSPTDDPDAYKTITDYMLHGPCEKDARNAACTTDGKCTKHFPKQFQAETFLDEEGYPHYRRRNNKVTFKKGKFTYDNRHVVPHNLYLLLKYKAHINVEWCNRSEAIKYLFKYLNKGPDRATIVIEENVKNGTTVALEKVLEKLPALLEKEGIDVTMFTDWFELNKRDPAARSHTYVEIPKHHVWHEKDKLWKQRK
nr:DNA helicase PIF1, ATP-dependent [Tanacetum cinerariifolium]GEW24774.1 DNA helicase PIF1, ATP-dependent [Tanacetum cinerariifolium]